MAVSPTRAGPTLVGTSATAIATAGAASTYRIIRYVIVANELDVSVKVTLGIYTSAADAAGRRIARANEIPANTEVEIGPLWMPLIGHASTPDILYAICDQASAATVTVGLVDGP